MLHRFCSLNFNQKPEPNRTNRKDKKLKKIKAGSKKDGSVVAVGWNLEGQCNVDSWTGIIQISAGGFHTVGLKSNGTVVAVGWNDFGQCNVENM